MFYIFRQYSATFFFNTDVYTGHLFRARVIPLKQYYILKINKTIRDFFNFYNFSKKKKRGKTIKNLQGAVGSTENSAVVCSLAQGSRSFSLFWKTTRVCCLRKTHVNWGPEAVCRASQSHGGLVAFCQETGDFLDCGTPGGDRFSRAVIEVIS